MRAVIWTDVLQLTIMIIGIGIILVKVLLVKLNKQVLDEL